MRARSWTGVARVTARAGARWATPLRSLLRYGAAPLLPPGSRLRDDAPVARLRRAARADLDGHGAGPLLARLGAELLWPGVIALQSLQNLRRNGGVVARASGTSRPRQLLEQWVLAWSWDLTPHHYYLFQLYRPEQRARAGLFLQRHELLALQRRLNAGLEWSRLDDKRTFYAHCVAHDLPTAPLVAALQGGELAWWRPDETLPACDLVLKPARLSSGKGMERWRHAGDTWSRRAERLDAGQLLARARARSSEGPLVIQERLAPHPDLADLGEDGTLCTARVTTVREPGGGIALVEAGLRMPTRPGVEVDNVGAGGILAPIERARGELTAAWDERGRRHAVHPRSGARIAGRPVPDWERLLPLCARAHRSVPEFSCVGWDVALSAQGPRLLEANTLWGCPIDPPLGETAFAAAALSRLEAQPG